MKKFFLMLALISLLSGCSVQMVFERVEDQDALPASASAKQLQLTFPKDVAVEVMESANGSLYICDGYTVCLQTLEGGDLDRSLRSLTGFSGDALTVMQTQYGDYRRYDTVWTSAGEGGPHTGRLALLDDSNFHYAAVVMADAGQAGELTRQWDKLLSSLELVNTG